MTRRESRKSIRRGWTRTKNIEKDKRRKKEAEEEEWKSRENKSDM